MFTQGNKNAGVNTEVIIVVERFSQVKF